MSWLCAVRCTSFSAGFNAVTFDCITLLSGRFLDPCKFLMNVVWMYRRVPHPRHVFVFVARVRSNSTNPAGCPIHLAFSAKRVVKHRIKRSKTWLRQQRQPRYFTLMYSARRNLSPLQSSSIATARTVSNPAAFSLSQPLSRLKSHFSFFEVPLG
jgi:hypothetical protein